MADLRAPVGLFAAASVLLAGCDGSSSPSPHVSASAPAPTPIAACPASVAVPPDTTRAVPNASLPPTAVIRAGGALSVDLPVDTTVGLGAPLARGAGMLLCRASSAAAGSAVLVGRQPGFVRVVVVSAANVQRAVNVHITV